MKLKFVLPFFVSGLIVALLLSKVGLGNFIFALSTVRPVAVFGFSLVLFVAILVKLYRWYYLANHVTVLRKRQAAYTYLSGQIVNEVLPTGSGELTRVYLAKKYSEKHYGELFAAVAFERACDVLFLMGGALVSLAVFFPEYVKTTSALMAFVLLAGGAVLLVFLRPDFAERLVRRLSFLKKLTAKWYGRLERFAASFAKATVFFKNKKSFVFSLALTALGWSLEVFGQTLLLSGFGVDFSFWHVFALATVSWIVGTFSFLPGGLGAREAAFAYLGSLLGAPFAVLLSMTLLYRGMVYLQFLVLGAGAAALEKTNLLAAVIKNVE